MSIPVLPNFVRWSWASVKAREAWAPKFANARHGMTVLERLAVAESVVPHVFQYVPARDLTTDAKRCLEYGLILVPLTEHDMDKRPTHQRPNFYHCLITRPDNYHPHLATLRTEGPVCCQIADSLRNNESVDATYEQLGATKGRPGLASTLWRPMGLRLIPHQPCSYSCESSIQRAKDIITLAEKHGFKDATDTIQEVLSWPFRYSRLFGITEVVTPVIRFYFRTDWTPTLEKYEVADEPKAIPMTLFRSPK